MFSFILPFYIYIIPASEGYFSPDEVLVKDETRYKEFFLSVIQLPNIILIYRNMYTIFSQAVMFLSFNCKWYSTGRIERVMFIWSNSKQGCSIDPNINNDVQSIHLKAVIFSWSICKQFLTDPTECNDVHFNQLKALISLNQLNVVIFNWSNRNV